MLQEKNYWKWLIFDLTISCYVLIKDPLAKPLSDEQIKRNRNKVLSKLLALSSACELLVKENETMNTSIKYL